MPAFTLRVLASAAALACASCNAAPATRVKPRPPEVIRIWPGPAPGTESWSGAEESADADLPNLGKVHVITNVTVPTLTIFRPAAGKANGTAMIVVPGGAFRALPSDLDGTETAHWLTARGITAFVLKYRVRPPQSSPGAESFDGFAARTKAARDIAVADAEQSVRVVRSRARQMGIKPHSVGMIGFSAGAMTTIGAALANEPSVRPDFVVSLYGALLDRGAPVKDSPPLFIVAAQDDPQAPPLRSAEMFESWTRAGAPAELHLYEKGGHGFAFRLHHLPVDHWPAVLQAWLQVRGYLGNQRGAGMR